MGDRALCPPFLSVAGLLFRFGRIVPKDFSRARRYYERAVVEPHPSGLPCDGNAMAELAQFCARGYGGVSQDLHRAEELIARARTSDGIAVERQALCDLVEQEIALRRAGYTCSTVSESWNPSRPLRLCERAGCGRREATDAEFKQCARCSGIVYCGRACQKLDWPRHRPVCQAIGKDTRKDTCDGQSTQQPMTTGRPASDLQRSRDFADAQITPLSNAYHEEEDL